VAAFSAFDPCAAGVDVTDLVIDGRHGEIAARGYRGPVSGAGSGSGSDPGLGTGPALVWAHGGGFIAGDLDMAEAHWVAVELARRGIPVLSVEYHKCLEGVHHPVPSDDVLDAWLWVMDIDPAFGVDTGRLHLGGASAGAHLCAGVTKRLRDGEGPMPASLVLAYPNLHPTMQRMSPALKEALAARGADFVFSADIMRDISLNYVGDEALFKDVYAFPANGDLGGQPPTFILNSEADTLRASGEAYGAQLAEAGVPVRVEYEPGTVHGHLNDPSDPAAERSIERMADWLLGTSPA
jgi:acetyl esterase/lipase